MVKMTFSIVIPTYNGSKFLEETIQSALSQIRKADEILVSDDNSSDNTIEICTQYASNIKIYENANGPSGFVNAWNNAISHASCEFITLLHQDDLLSPEYLYCVEEALLKNPGLKHIYSGYKSINEHFVIPTKEPAIEFRPVVYNGKDYTKNYISGVFYGKHLHRCPGVTTEKKLLLDTCTYREEAGHIADDDFFIRIGNYTDIIGIDSVLAYYREHPYSTTNKQNNLSFILAKDWLFQVREFYLNKNKLLDAEDGKRLAILAVRDLTTALLTALIRRDHETIKEILNIKETIHSLTGIYPTQISTTMNKKILWVLIDKEMFSLARIYAGLVIRAKNIK